MSESYIFHRHRVKKQKQIDDKSADRDDPSSTFRLYVVKFGPNVIEQSMNIGLGYYPRYFEILMKFIKSL